MRLREVVFHHVDLDAGFGFADIEPDLQRLFLEEEVRGCARPSDAPDATLRTPEGDEWTVGAGTASVTGSRAALLGWLARGLTDGVGGDPLPRLPEDGDAMAYTGHVVPGGPTDIRALGRATIRKMSVSEMHNNVYLVTCNATGEQLLVDAADDPHRCLLLVREGTGRLDHLVTTHQHWDHVRALEEVAAGHRRHDVCRRDDADALPVAPDVRLRHGDVVTVGELELDVIHLRGHTPGSVALSWADPDGDGTHLFTGDSLFPGGVGNTKRPEQSFESLYRDVVERVFATHDDGTWFYPGTGDDSTIGARKQRRHLERVARRGGEPATPTLGRRPGVQPRLGGEVHVARLR